LEDGQVNGLRRRAWWVLIVFSVAVVVFGAMDVVMGAVGDRLVAFGLTGQSHEQLVAEGAATYRMYDFTSRTQAWGLVTVGLLLLGILLGPYRRGDRWAWRMMWLMPAWSLTVPAMYLVFGLVPGTPPPPPLISGSIVGVISVIVLLLDRGRGVAGRADGATATIRARCAFAHGHPRAPACPRPRSRGRARGDPAPRSR
jgi:hypothetical protein